MSASVNVLTGVIIIMSVFTALGLACAVWHAMLRPYQADPYARAFGDLPGFSPEQLRAITRLPAANPANPLRASYFARDLNSAGIAISADAGSGWRSIPSRLVAVRKYISGGPHACSS